MIKNAMKEQTVSIFRKYYSEQAFEDRYLADRENAVDVIIPIIHANELWENNLLSFYREIPINRLLIGDGGCCDGSIEIVKQYPRVVILDHKHFTSLGYSIRKLIEAVETEWFVYLHSDVYLPEDWFAAMKTHKNEYDWFGCPQQLTVMVEYPNVDKLGDQERPYAGSQMGRKTAFLAGLNKIEDDYVYRQEDFVFADIIKKAGFKEGKIHNTFHYHQVMHKPSQWGREIKKVIVDVDWSNEEKIRASTMLIKGCIKYLDPSPLYSSWVICEYIKLLDFKCPQRFDLIGYVKAVNPKWLAFINTRQLWAKILMAKIRNAFKRFS
jgi:hypothetical protein